MIDFTLADVMKAVGSKKGQNINPQARIAGVCIDSREVIPENLFIPLPGERTDGHRYVVSCMEKGAAASLWQIGRPYPPEDVPLIFVKDTLQALQDLSRAYRDTLQDTTIIGVTGSSGKTTTKDIIAAVAAVGYATQKTAGNHNNEIGVPLTLLSLNRSTQIAVVEMGIDDFGQMDLLGRLVRPDVAVITSLSESHIDHFGSLERIAQEKWKITGNLNPQGLFLYNGDYDLLNRMRILHPAKAKTISFGFGEANDAHVTSRRIMPDGLYFMTNACPQVEFHLDLLGEHEITNALSALLVGLSLGLTAEEIQAGFSRVHLTAMREDVRKFGKSVLIDGTYNSNPGSLAAGLKMLGDYPVRTHKIAVLGDMYGLGDQAEELHRKVGRTADFAGISEIWAYGTYAPLVGEEAHKRYPSIAVRVYNTTEELEDGLYRASRGRNLILAKASRAAAFDQILQRAEGRYER